MTTTTWKPRREDYLEALQDQNPWGKLGHVPETFAKPTRRPLAEQLWQALLVEPPRYQVVMGPRRVGKTVAMYQTIDQLIKNGVEPDRLWFLRLDHPLLMHYELGGWAKSLIKNFSGSAQRPIYLFLDEVNYSKSWDKWLKTFYDEKWPVRVVATSSSTAALRDRSIESGIGRWSEQYLTPYMFSEFLQLRGMDTKTPHTSQGLFETLAAVVSDQPDYRNLSQLLKLFLLVGGFPELLEALREDDIESGLFRSQQVLRSEAVQRVAGMDIPQAFDIKNPLLLERLLYILAGQMCGLMNLSQLAKDLELSRQTVHQYIQYLEQAYLIFTLPNYSNNEESIQRKGRKAFFVDGAVRNAALQRGLGPMQDPSEWGHLTENAAASHLYAMSLQNGGRLFHWRHQDHEVDFVYNDGSRPMAFEVARSSGHSIGGLMAIQERYPELRGRCFLVTSSGIGAYSMPSEETGEVGRVPLEAFLLAVGAQTGSALSRRLGLGTEKG